MNRDDPTTIASYGLAIAAALRSYDIDPVPVFSNIGLTIEHVYSPTMRMTVGQVAKLYEACIDLTGDEHFSLRTVKHLNLGIFHAFGFSLAASATLRDFCNRLVRSFSLVSSAGKFRIEEKQDFVRLTLYGVNIHTSPHTIDAFLAYLVRLMRQIYKPDFAPVSVSLGHPATTANTNPFDDFFGVPVKFGQSDIFIDIAQEDADRELAGSNPEIALINDGIIREYLIKIYKEDVVNRVRSEIGKRLTTGEVNKKQVAKAIGMSSRSFQEKLRKKNTSFSQILDEMRKTLAIAYLESRELSIGEIAYKVGYADAPGFTKAFKRWTGQSPSRYISDKSR